MRKFATNTSLVLIATAISLLFSEIVIRYVAPQPLSGSWRVATDTGLMVNRSTGKAVHESAHIRVEYEFHAPGLRDTKLNATAITVLVLGDSFTFGWLLDADKTYVNHLQVRADREFGVQSFNFVNAAAGGWGTADYVAYTEEFGEEIGPEIVLVFLNTDDIGRSLSSGLFTMVDSSKLLLRRNVLPVSRLKRTVNLLPGYQFVLENSHLVQLLRHVTVFGFGLRTPQRRSGANQNPEDLSFGPRSEKSTNPSEAIRLGQALFLRLKAWCDKRSIRLIALTTGWHKTHSWAGSEEPTEAFMREAAQFFQRNQITYHDISPDVRTVVDSRPGDYLIANEGHPNARGAALIAEHAWNALRDHLQAYCRLTSKCSRSSELRG